MNILHMSISISNWLKTYFAINNFLVREVCFEDPEICSFMRINWSFFFNFESIVVFNQLYKIKMRLWNKILKKQGQKLILVWKFKINFIELSSNNADCSITFIWITNIILYLLFIVETNLSIIIKSWFVSLKLVFGKLYFSFI
jgi:hypothetical protein